jgi:hypothetical protein
MFALCFTSTAAVDLRRAQVRKTTRKTTNPALKAVRVGLASLAIVLAATTLSFAGKNGGNGGGENGGSRSGGNNSFRIQSTPKFSQSTPKLSQSIQSFKATTPTFTQKSTKSIGTFNNSNTLNNFNTPKNFTLKTPIKLDVKKMNSSGRSANPWNPKIEKKIGGLTDVINKKPTVLTFPANKKLDGIFSDHGKGNGHGNGNGNKNDCHNGNGNGKNKCHDWNWCWKQHCKPCYKPCQQWHCWNYPTWCNLHRHRCGYYVNVPVVVVHGIDLQLLAIRFVDNGDPTQNLGPRFRVWIRNNTPTPVIRPFNVLVMAARDVVPSADLPQAGVRIDAMQPGQILPVDIRLPVQASDASLGMMHVLVDSHREVPEVFEDNNGIVLPRAEVLSVDPALLAADVQAAVPGAEINVAGEGLGVDAGQVIVKLAGLDMPGEVLGWSELGLRIRLPVVQIVNPVDAQIIAIRADGKAIRPLPLKVIPGQTVISAQPTGVQPATAISTDQATAVQAMFGG